MNKRIITIAEVNAAAERIASVLRAGVNPGTNPELLTLYGIPRGGIVPAYAVAQAATALKVWERVLVVNEPAQADVFIDDIVDSGRTRDMYVDRYRKPFAGLFIKSEEWLVFPWERTESEDTSAEDIVVRFLQFIGEDVNRTGLKDTPARIVKAWEHWFSGYGKDHESVMTAFEDGVEHTRSDQMVVVGPIKLYSHCEHHGAPIVGHAHIGYIPNGKILGLSKFSRLVEIYARRLQVQERLGDQIANALDDVLKPKGVAVMIEAEHLCMSSRGVSQHEATTKTTVLRGIFIHNPHAKQEFLTHCYGR